jgi:mannan endo-1,4-beta-mannosidase
MLAAHGVTCLRLMLEYSQSESRYLEQPAGRFKPNMVRLWDDMLALCERHGLRVLLTPFDTFWMWKRWARHPYNRRNGGPCAVRKRLLVCPETRAAVRARMEFATRRWGASGVIFAWDLWNEIHPAQAGDSPAPLAGFVSDVGAFLRDLETRVHGRPHPQTVSAFGPQLALHGADMFECVYRHPGLDFASIHIYEEGAIDFPRNTVDAAISTGRLVREALAEIPDTRPFFDSEHGPIHAYKDHHRTLPAAFDDEYFRHMQWAHFASGGAGGGMRWPNRNPHRLTPGMRVAQRALSGFLPLIDWRRFSRANWSAAVEVSAPGFAAFACGTRDQAVVWLLRTGITGPDGRVRRDAPPLAPCIALPEMAPGRYRIAAWDTEAGVPGVETELVHSGGRLAFAAPPIVTDMAFAVTPGTVVPRRNA